MTVAFVAGLVTLLVLAGTVEAPHPVVAVVLIGYAIAARADFPIGSGHVVPTQLFLVPLFVLAPAALVPALVFVGLAIGLLGEVAFGRSRLDRLAYCGGDSIHALGPALVLTLFAGGHAATAAPEVLLSGVRRPAGLRLRLLEPARPARVRHAPGDPRARAAAGLGRRRRAGADRPGGRRSGLAQPVARARAAAAGGAAGGDGRRSLAPHQQRSRSPGGAAVRAPAPRGGRPASG